MRVRLPDLRILDRRCCDDLRLRVRLADGVFGNAVISSLEYNQQTGVLVDSGQSLRSEVTGSITSAARLCHLPLSSLDKRGPYDVFHGVNHEPS